MKRFFAMTIAVAAMFAFPAITSASINVGFFTNNDSAVPHAQSVASGLGYNFVDLTDLSNLAGIDVLWAMNSANFSQLPDLTTYSANVSAFVNGGGFFMYHDREVDNAESVLPGGGAFNITRDFSADSDINVIDNSTLVTNGPGGVINNTNLDGGSSSSHGFAFSGSLPGTSVQILSRTNASEIVDFSYGFGSGNVYYSSIPLDFYFSGSLQNPTGDAFRDIYGPNVLAYAGSNAGSNLDNIVPEPGAIAIWSVLGLAGVMVRRRKV